jgi:Fuc2NAc and GlcNAc transferase
MSAAMVAAGLHGAVLALSWVGVLWVRRYATRRLLDIPNERSSHARPTPRGGGLAITVAHFSGVACAAALGFVPWSVPLVLAGGLAVAFVGFLDDHGHVSPTWRLGCHVLAFLWAVAWIGGLPPVDFGWGALNLGWAGSFLLVLYAVWYLNLYNFMDGIDGIAAVQALAMSIGAVMIFGGPWSDSPSTLCLGLLAAAVAGFLAWNWPPARIFMGDVGSGYIGFALGALAMYSIVDGLTTPWVWLILGGAFLADATVTLFSRAWRREPVTQAHRSHAYQRLSRHWRGHRPVTLAYAAVNVAWLWPWAWLAQQSPEIGGLLTLAALVPLFIAAQRLGAGKPGDIG